MLFNDDGSVLYVMGQTGDDINAYTLSTAYDISTATFDEIALSVSGQESDPTAMLFNDDGSVLYVMGSGGDDINAYTLGDGGGGGGLTADLSSGVADFTGNGLKIDLAGRYTLRAYVTVDGDVVQGISNEFCIGDACGGGGTAASQTLIFGESASGGEGIPDSVPGVAFR